MSSLTIDLPDNTIKQLNDASRAQGTTSERLAEDFIERMLAVREFRRLAELTEPYAREAGFTCEEDFFREIS